MKLEDFTPELVTPVIEAIVAEYGEDYIYKPEQRDRDFGGVECEYFDRLTNEPSCLVGHVIDRLGAKKEIDELNNFIVAIGLVADKTPVWFALDTAQQEQDSGESWGVALKKYHERLNAYN